MTITVTGKWTLLADTTVKKVEAASGVTSPTSRAESRIMSRDGNEGEEEEENVSAPMSERSERSSALISLSENEVTTRPPATMSLRTLLRTTREFSLAEHGRGYLRSHKEKMKERESRGLIAAEERKKLDPKTAHFTTKRRQIVLVFSVLSTDDVASLSEKVWR